ncbi:MAG TPA: amino acid ABC transporter ATP-binding protein [Lachnospiraceae bacterium]|nr:amino acid ABC transporter ATP-binding protein [Lachnospiraceae bacterium]
MIEIKNVKKSFKNLEVLKGVSLDVEDGEVVVILGPSGSGKTTLLRCISFLEKADEGELKLNKYEVSLKKANKKQINELRKNMAFVFQNYNLFANKTVLENVMEGLTVARKVPRKEAEERALEALEWVGVLDKKDSYPSELSGGQQQRVGIARAVVLHPEVILFDEPTSALDPELVGEVLEIIRKVARSGITMIVVTHEIAFAEEVASKIVFMDGGVVVEQGKPNEILVSPKEERTKEFLARVLPKDMYYI